MRALLVLGGEEIPFLHEAENADLIICADKGADYANRQGIIPDVVLGDMDSVSDVTLEDFENKNVKIIKYPAEKNKTDGEIAVDFARNSGAKFLEIVCAEGSTDHFLGNLHLLIYAKKTTIKTRLLTEDMSVYLTDSEIELEGEKGKRVSILPAGGEIEVKKASGLYYEINEPLVISFGQTVGLGNYMTGPKCKIEISKGMAFVLVER